jgi:hypothetical protein
MLRPGNWTRPAGVSPARVIAREPVGCIYSSTTAGSEIVESKLARHSGLDRAYLAEPAADHQAGDTQPLDRQLRCIYSARPCCWRSSMPSSVCWSSSSSSAAALLPIGISNSLSSARSYWSSDAPLHDLAGGRPIA